jgi:phosphatidylserine/phosphatidylglycerophosphate/cardiolipin synthase-like enzyme
MIRKDGYYSLDSAILTGDSSVVFSRSEFSFKEILGEIEKTEYLLISTYNLGDADGRLMTLLNDLETSTNITIITNVPDYAYLYKKRKTAEATRALEEYKQRLKPLTERDNTTIYFSFKNHGKLIVTDRMVYLGSANFSDSSAWNDEVGLLIRNCDGMGIGKKYWELISHSVLPLMTPALDPMVQKIEKLESAFRDISPDDHDYPGSKSDAFWLITSRVCELSTSLLELKELAETAGDFFCPFNFFDRDLVAKALELIAQDEIQQALKFDREDFISKKLEIVSDEEHMSASQERAFQQATEEESRLYYNAYVTMGEIWEIVGKLADASVSSIENFD